MAKEYVIVHPAKHFIDRKGNDLCTKTRNAIAGKLKSANLFNGNAIFGIQLFIPCVITHIDINYNNNKTSVMLFGDKFIVDSVNDITKFGIQWKSIVEPFFNKIQKAIQKNGEVWSHNEKWIDSQEDILSIGFH